jgi:hypothetical protein
MECESSVTKEFLMKALPKVLIFTAILAAIAGCGKSNESGRSGVQGPCISYGSNNQCNGYASGYTANGAGINPNQVLQENPCIMGGGRQVIQTQVQVQTNPNVPPTIVPQGDLYVGVTSYGDVAFVMGNGSANPTFIAHLCQRPVSGQGMVMPQILVGAATVCAFKYITAANVRFPDGSQANFRALSPGGSSARQKFSFCQQ